MYVILYTYRLKDLVTSLYGYIQRNKERTHVLYYKYLLCTRSQFDWLGLKLIDVTW